MSRIKYTDLYAQYKTCELDVQKAIQYCIETSSYITGPVIDRFEEKFASYQQAEQCAAVGSGSMALILALKAIGIEPGDEVITTSMTFVATPESIVNTGGVPVFVDVQDDFLIHCDAVQKAINHKTKAILVVDLYGQCPRMERLREIADSNNLYLIQDSAQSVGTVYNGKPVGQYADLTCYSFNPVKNFGAMGDAGGVTGSAELIEKVKLYRDHGRSARYMYDEIGYNSRMDCIQAEILSAKLPYLEQWIKIKRDIAEFYNENLGGSVVHPYETPGNEHSYYAYVIRSEHRDELQKFLEHEGIGTNIHYRTPCHVQPAYKQYRSCCPNAEKLSSEILSLPIHLGLTPDDTRTIVEAVHKWGQKHV